MSQTSAFIDDVLPEAVAAAKALDYPVAVILAQWINETGSGSSTAWRNGNNPAGISIMEPQMERLGAQKRRGWGEILAFPSREAGLLAYILRWRDPVYAPFRNSIVGNPDPNLAAIAVQNSEWAEGHYDHHGLQDLVREFDLAQYDHLATGTAPGPVSDPGTPAPTGDTPCSGLPVGPPPNGIPLLRIGSRGADVAGVQKRLADAGFAPLDSRKSNGQWDGIFGAHTTEAVVNFQNAHGLHPDGIVGRQTWCAFGVR